MSKISKVSQHILQEVYDRGIGAYKTNPTSVRMKGSFKKGVDAPMKAKLSKEQWAMARVYSFLDGNLKHDNDLRLQEHTKHDLIELVHQMKCGMLKDMNVDAMTKEEIVSHLLKSKCPMVMKLMKQT